MMNIRQYLDTIFHTQGYEAWEKEDQYMWDLMEQDIDQEIETGVEGHAFEDYCASKGVDLAAPHCGLPGTVLQYWCMDHYEQHTNSVLQRVRKGVDKTPSMCYNSSVKKERTTQ